jgi:hypothetical protein
MSGQQPDGGDHSLAAELRLRPDRPRVTRVSRKVLIGLGTVASISVLGLTYWALQSHAVVRGKNFRPAVAPLESIELLGQFFP